MGEPVIVMTPEQLRELVTTAVREAMGGRTADNSQGPAYLTVPQAAELLQGRV